MKIKYLGTAAAEGIPALFCECELCRRAREIGGKNIRSRCQVLVNDDLLIDYPPDSFYHFVNNKIDITKINNLLITHSHEDHFYPPDFSYFLQGFSHPKLCVPFTIYGSNDLKKDLDPLINNKNNQGLRYVSINPYNTYKIGNYYVTPLEASHGTEHPYIYIISDGAKGFLFCHDSGLLKEDVFNYLKENKHYFALISLDCTTWEKPTYPSNHMNLDLNKETIDKLKSIGAIDSKTKIILNHFSHNGGNVLYDEMNKIAEKNGFIISYDGLEIEF